MQTTDDPVPLAHTVPDACRRIGIGRTVFYEQVAAGRIRTFKLGSRTLVPETELRRFVADLMQEAA